MDQGILRYLRANHAMCRQRTRVNWHESSWSNITLNKVLHDGQNRLKSDDPGESYLFLLLVPRF